MGNAAEVPDMLLTSEEVARMFKVSPKTVLGWAKAELIPYVWTPGGRRRFRQSQMVELMLRQGRKHQQAADRRKVAGHGLGRMG